MDVDNENIEPVTDSGLALGNSDQCIQRILDNASGAGANAGSRIHMTFVAPEPLSELVWSPHKGPSNVPLSPPKSNTGGRSATDKPFDEQNFMTSQTLFHVKSEVAGIDMTMPPTSYAGIMPVCGLSHEHETGIGGTMEEVKTAVEVYVPYNRESICSPVNSQVDGIPEIPGTREKKITTLSGNIHREGADILVVDSDDITLVDQSKPSLGDPIWGDRHADVHNKEKEMGLVLTSEVLLVNEKKTLGVPLVNQKPQVRRPSDKMEATAENDLENIKRELDYGATSQILRSESAPGVKDRFEKDEEMLPGNKSVLDEHSPTNSIIHIHQREGKEKALYDGELNRRMSKDEDESHESVESCNSARLVSSGKKRWSFEEQFSVGSKRFRKQIQETPTCMAYIRQDSSFMNWISSMVNGFSKSMQDEAPSLALALAHPDHGHENSDKKLITCNMNQDDGLKNIGFRSIFQSLYCPKAEHKEARMVNDNHHIVAISTVLEPAATPKAYHGDNIGISRGFLLSVDKFKTCSSASRPKSSSGKAASQEKGNANSVEKKNPCNFPFYKKRHGVSSNSSLGKRKEKSIENVESSPKSVGETTDKCGRRSDLLESLWITRFTPKAPSPSLITDHYNQSADGVLECSNDRKNVLAKEQSTGDLVLVIGNDLQNCAADNKGSSAFNRNKDQNCQKSMASVFARRLDALKHITPSGATGNAANEILTCFFCGKKGHRLQECSEIRDTELQELQGKCKSFSEAESLPCFCIRCFKCSHWAVACPNAPSMGQTQLDCNVSCLDYYCSPSETKLNSRNDRNMRLLTDKESQLQASVANTFFDGDKSRIEADLNLRWKANKMITSKKMKYSASSSGVNKLKENQIMPLSQFFNTQISDVPKGIFDSVKRLRLSRTDVLKWMNSHTSLSQLEGFFLRLRLGKWEGGLGGTGYHVSCITGSQRESCPENVKDSIAVVVGGVRCLVKSQYVSNNDFHEDELRAWWSATSKGNGEIPSEEGFREKIKKKEMLGL